MKNYDLKKINQLLSEYPDQYRIWITCIELSYNVLQVKTLHSGWVDVAAVKK